MTHPQQQLIDRAKVLAAEFMDDGSPSGPDQYRMVSFAQIERLILAALSAGAVPQQEPQECPNCFMRENDFCPSHFLPSQVVLCSCTVVTGGHRAPNQACPLHGRQAGADPQPEPQGHEDGCSRIGKPCECKLKLSPAVPALPAPQEQDK